MNSMKHPEKSSKPSRRSFLAAAALGGGAAHLLAQGAQTRIYIGTYTRQNSKGIYVCGYDSMGIRPPVLAAETSNPSFLTVDSERGLLYAANEHGQGSVSAFAIDRSSGALKFLNSVSSKGSGPCHVALDRVGKWLFVANYNSGTVAVLPVHAGGALGEASDVKQHSGSSVNPQRQAGPHAHMAAPSPDNRFLLAPDLGLDRVLVYRFDAAKGLLTPNDPPFLKTAAGFGPRHLAFGKDAHFVYVLGEMAASVTVFRYDAARGSGDPVQTVSMLPDDYTGPKSGAEISVDARGRFLYASNRGHDSIAIFRIDAGNGTLTAAGRVPAQVKTPRSFAIDPAGAYLLTAGQDSSRIATFRIDPASGGLTPSGDLLQVPFPVCIAFATI